MKKVFSVICVICLFAALLALPVQAEEATIHVGALTGPTAMGMVKLLADGEVDRAVLVCSTGIGISIAANKVKGIRCALCSEPYSAEMTRRHNDANCLAMGGLMVGDMMAERIVDTFLNTEFEGGRHSRRIGKIADIEEKERQ